jgi:uncharacterized protein YcbX
MTDVGRIAEIWRFPVKTMAGERVAEAAIGPLGMRGDRAWMLVDAATGQRPTTHAFRKRKRMLEWQAAFDGEGTATMPPPVTLTAPDGTVVRSDDPEAAGRLSALLNHPVRLAVMRWEGHPPNPVAPGADAYENEPIHLMTTASLAAMRAANPAADFAPRRFRANLVVETPPGVAGTVEDAWVGRTVAIGDLRLSVLERCVRCAITTMAQEGLPQDPSVLATVSAQNGTTLGVYATVVARGTVREGDAVRLLD